jgi:DNA polymerase-3 subunit alpha
MGIKSRWRIGTLNELRNKMSKYTPLHVHSHYSLLDGLSKPEDILKRTEKIGSDACALTDHGTLGGSVDFFKTMKGKKKAILGNELYICDQSAKIQDKTNRSLAHLVVLAKNKNGWRNLIRATSEGNKQENFYHRPRLSLDELQPFTTDLMAFSGHLGSHLANVLFPFPKLAYKATTEADAAAILDPDAKKKAIAMIEKFQYMFGENFAVEIQLMDSGRLPAQKVVASILREAAIATGSRCIATPDAHYTEEVDCYDQRVLLCSALATTFPQVQSKLDQAEDVGLGGFFTSDKYHIPTYEQMLSYGHTVEELANTNLFADMVDSYDILSKPMLPKFPCPNGMSDDEYLRQLCRDGWVQKIAKVVPKDQHGTYADRVKYELSVLQGAELSSYFLILHDIVNYTRKQGWLVGPGRGSAAGCLVSYLIGLTSIDPIKYGLIFERFYNAGRNTKDRVSMPDIDIDIPSTKRQQIINYIKSVYGENRVSQIITYQTIKGRGALKEVLRAYGSVPFETMNKITEHIPDPAKIAGDLQLMKEEEGESSIIKWALENSPEKFSEWCVLKDDGTLEGPLSKMFAQAIRLEGTKKSASRHASGIVVAPDDLHNVCPMVTDKGGENLVAGWEMGPLEDTGSIKMDILGVSYLNKMQGISEILTTGDISV